MSIILCIAILLLLVLWVVSVQNALVRSDELCNNAIKQINVQQISRFDALQVLVKLTREYASFEADTIQKIIAERKIATGGVPSVADINANEAVLGNAVGRLIAVAEQYPDLKASANYKEAMAAIQGYEENVRLSRMTFNDTVTKYNNKVRMFPGSLVAGVLGFGKREYLADDSSKKDYPQI